MFEAIGNLLAQGLSFGFVKFGDLLDMMRRLCDKSSTLQQGKDIGQV